MRRGRGVGEGTWKASIDIVGRCATPTEMRSTNSPSLCTFRRSHIQSLSEGNRTHTHPLPPSTLAGDTGWGERNWEYPSPLRAVVGLSRGLLPPVAAARMAPVGLHQGTIFGCPARHCRPHVSSARCPRVFARQKSSLKLRCRQKAVRQACQRRCIAQHGSQQKGGWHRLFSYLVKVTRLGE